MLCGVQQTSKWSRARCLPFVAVRHLQRCERCQQGQWSPNTNEDARRGSKGGTGPRIGASFMSLPRGAASLGSYRLRALGELLSTQANSLKREQ